MKLGIKASNYLENMIIINIADFMVSSPSPNCINVSKLLIIYVQVTKARL